MAQWYGPGGNIDFGNLLIVMTLAAVIPLLLGLAPPRARSRFCAATSPTTSPK